jgi:hypothetical protein
LSGAAGGGHAAEAQLVRAVCARDLIVEPPGAVPLESVDVAERAARVRRDEPRPVDAEALPAAEVVGAREAEPLLAATAVAHGETRGAGPAAVRNVLTNIRYLPPSRTT